MDTQRPCPAVDSPFRTFDLAAKAAQRTKSVLGGGGHGSGQIGSHTVAGQMRAHISEGLRSRFPHIASAATMHMNVEICRHDRSLGELVRNVRFLILVGTEASDGGDDSVFY